MIASEDPQLGPSVPRKDEASILMVTMSNSTTKACIVIGAAQLKGACEKGWICGLNRDYIPERSSNDNNQLSSSFLFACLANCCSGGSVSQVMLTGCFVYHLIASYQVPPLANPGPLNM